ncbi:precorrin-6Y methyltransferase [Rhodomicrobium udaipurense JA643]|uniref:Bifunctional cobalt-precorrin-7 (C(5))-methyltransferase/cobalt-precorrin-6B (C(15))-methyltransferase n=1 Tax=Rhodomicrobium udaipurense TaxID=1202716 RepID=A0A8I1GGF9_9HYPH|nr:bifunctional cobalt-precorrin-7 (C(5))-methyltransferase/cobalt-precorrin-6B (C(15))-methyltransferase [Rhodomicrobium udaipurense]KAI94491.1 precorrin-6Y methyltransferase [Rhodomicrobium udaipurense JA643]MBJ7544283.1 bifunctional cobalt-precorrin-7 (C(5))-methyltransferase/cobalt-precorrin-6B (C(15))-methyltransferase [Rhodomicrobium udaipurense]
MMETRETNTLRRWLSIVGIGEDGVEGLTAHARALVSSAELVVGGARHLALAAPLIRGETLPWPSPLHDAFPLIAERRGRPVCVLASGDPFHYGVGKQIATFASADEILCVPQPSSFSLAASRMAWALQDVAAITLHGRALEGLVRHLFPGARILALSWDGSTPAKAARLLTDLGFGASICTVLEEMGGMGERVSSARADAFTLDGIAALNVFAIEVAGGADARIVPLTPGLDDSLFESDGLLTKREVRAVTLAALAPRPGELLWDIGLGSGSIAIEWLLRHPTMRAIGIEENTERAARAMRNALALGAPDLRVVQGRAPDALADLPAPDAVFVGGGLTDAGVFDAAWNALKLGGRIVANAVTLESEALLVDAFKRRGGELTRIEISRASALGSFTGWRAAMPVTQWRAVKS